MENKKALVVYPVTETQKQSLRESAPDWEWKFAPITEISDEELALYQVVAGNIPPKRLNAAKNLQWMQLNSAGYDPYVGVLDEEILLTNAVGAYGPAVSEHMLAMVFALQKRLHTYSRQMLEGNWNDAGMVTSIDGAQVLVIGLGDIGQAFAKKAAALGAHVTGIRRNLNDKPAYVEHLASLEDLMDLLPKMDIVAVILPGSEENRNLFSAKQFKAMKKGSIFINAGRGMLVDQDALLQALKEGPLGFAGIDVTAPEPLPSDSPLWKQENLLITPHVAGGFHLQKTLDNIVAITIENMKHFTAGEKLRNAVNH